MSIAAEFLKQIILVAFYIAIIVLAVKFGIKMAKKKELEKQKQ